MTDMVTENIIWAGREGGTIFADKGNDVIYGGSSFDSIVFGRVSTSGDTASLKNDYEGNA